MHWLEQQVHRLDRLLEELPRETVACRAALRDLVAEVAARAGVAACFACYDGLLVARAGGEADYEALAAIAQSCVAAGRQAADALALGGVQQLLVVGDARKLALMVMGPFAVGVLAPIEVQLSRSLA
jgi:predicted regulator of Ras-like GTPase activity (Roadblock/LC7/MglB family)